MAYVASATFARVFAYNEIRWPILGAALLPPLLTFGLSVHLQGRLAVSGLASVVGFIVLASSVLASSHILALPSLHALGLVLDGLTNGWARALSGPARVG